MGHTEDWGGAGAVRIPTGGPRGAGVVTSQGTQSVWDLGAVQWGECTHCTQKVFSMLALKQNQVVTLSIKHSYNLRL